MRSRISRVCTRVSVLIAGLISGLLTFVAVANAGSRELVVAQAAPLESLTTPVGLTAVTLGVIGMVAGAFRKKKIQPENQRRG